MKALLLVLFPALLCAETITSSAFCSGDGITVTGTTACQIGQHYANVNQYFSLSVGGSISAYAMASAEGDAYQTGDPYFHTVAFSAQGSFQITEYFITLGSGTGYMEATGQFLISELDGGASSDLTVGYPGGAFVGAFYCDYSGCAGSHQLVPFQLGTPLEVVFTGEVSGSGDPNGDTPGFSSFGGSAQFNFFEADQTTPVAVVVMAPEPSSLYLLSVGGFVVLAASNRRRIALAIRFRRYARGPKHRR